MSQAQRKIRVIVAPVNEPLRFEEIVDELKAYQRICGGDIEDWALPTGLRLFCHGEGLLIGLPPNRVVDRLGLVVGPFLVTRLDVMGHGASVEDGDLERIEAISTLATNVVID